MAPYNFFLLKMSKILIRKSLKYISRGTTEFASPVHPRSLIITDLVLLGSFTAGNDKINEKSIESKKI
jgi:hypothetical protein